MMNPTEILLDYLPFDWLRWVHSHISVVYKYILPLKCTCNTKGNNNIEKSKKQMTIKKQIYQPRGELPGYDQVPLCGPVCLWRATDLHEDKISATLKVKKIQARLLKRFQNNNIIQGSKLKKLSGRKFATSYKNLVATMCIYFNYQMSEAWFSHATNIAGT